MNALAKWLLMLCGLTCVGCNGGRLSVEGSVKYPDGTPVPGGTVIAEATVDGKLVGIQGNIEPDGSFKLGGTTPGDGALPGKYRAMIMPVALSDADLSAGKTPALGGKYAKMDSAGIQFEVAQGMGPLTITVDKPTPKTE